MEGLDREGRPQKPDFFVDVASVIDTKRKMLACHASQRNWLKRQHGMDDYMRQMEEWTAATGRQIGVRFAEGFRRYPAHPYPQEPKLEEAVAGFRAAP
jgi:LmbE family N-acetylglucosaminyl deacetylase